MTKYQGNYEETARNLPPNGKASEMYVANYPSPNLHFYFDDHSLQLAWTIFTWKWETVDTTYYGL